MRIRRSFIGLSSLTCRNRTSPALGTNPSRLTLPYWMPSFLGYPSQDGRSKAIDREPDESEWSDSWRLHRIDVSLTGEPFEQHQTGFGRSVSHNADVFKRECHFGKRRLLGDGHAVVMHGHGDSKFALWRLLRGLAPASRRSCKGRPRPLQ